MADPNKNTPEDVIGGIDPNAFDAQMLLLDIFLDNIPDLDLYRTGEVEAVKDPFQNVPYLPAGFDSVNALTGVSRDGTIGAINNFISNLTPLENAKMYPIIELQVIDQATGVPFLIPIGPTGDRGVSGIERGRDFRRFGAQQEYYVRNEIGLKSLSMQLDGNDLPFFGKSYIVKSQLVLDSINTFTSPIAGIMRAFGYPVSFAQVFRSSGVVGSDRFYIRLSISFGCSDQELINKYALNSPQMRFNLMLTLTETKISVDENLKVQLDVTFQSREEALFNSNLLFDFLGLDLTAEEADKRSALNSAREQMKVLDKEKSTYISKTREAVLNNPGYKHMDNLFKGLSDEEFEAKEDAGAYDDIDDAEDLREKYKQIQEDITEKKLSEKFDNQESVKQAREHLENKKNNAIEKLSNLRHDLLKKAIEETFNFSDRYGTAVGTVYLSSQQIYDYYNQASLSEQKKKDLTKEESKSVSTKFKQNVLNDMRKAATGESPSTVTPRVKEKPKEGDKAGDSKEPERDTSRYEAEATALLIDLGNQKQIDYILFGDIMRLVYQRLYKILPVQINKLGKIQPGTNKETFLRMRSSLEKTMLLFSEITFEGFEQKVKDPANLTLSTRSLFDVPISIKNLRYILAKKLYGKQQNYFTIFQLMEELINLVSLTRKRKAQVLNNQSTVGNFTLKKMTYPLQMDLDGSGDDPLFTQSQLAPIQFDSKSSAYGAGFRGTSGTPAGADGPVVFRINTDNKISVSEIFSGMLIYVKRAKDNKRVRNSESLCPKFIFGGAATGAVLSFQINEIMDSDLQKLVMEQVRGADDQVIPSFFEVEIKTAMLPFFQLGMQIKVAAPTLDGTAGKNTNIFIAGDYQISSIVHEYSSGSNFTTKIKATLYDSDKKAILKSKGLVSKDPSANKSTPLHQKVKKITGLGDKQAREDAQNILGRPKKVNLDEIDIKY